MKIKTINLYFLLLILSRVIIYGLYWFQFSVFGNYFISLSFIGELFWFTTIFAFCNNNDLSYKSIFSFRKVKCFNIFAAILCGIIVTIVSILTNCIYIKLNITFPHGNLANYPSSYIFFDIITVIILAPIIEEILFRGVFYNLFSRYKGPLIGIVVSTLYFVILHMRLSNIITAILLGVCAALFFEVTHSLIPGIIIHAINNIVLTFLSKIYLINVGMGLLSLIILILLFIVVLFVFCSKVVYVNSQKSVYQLVTSDCSQDKTEKIIDVYFIIIVLIWVFLISFMV